MKAPVLADSPADDGAKGAHSKAVEGANESPIVVEVCGITANCVARHNERGAAETPVGQAAEQVKRPVVGCLLFRRASVHRRRGRRPRS